VQGLAKPQELAASSVTIAGQTSANVAGDQAITKNTADSLYSAQAVISAMQARTFNSQLVQVINNVVGSGVRADTHANRLANYPASGQSVGSLFFETDRTVLYVVVGGGNNQWDYAGGVMYGTLSPDLKPSDLGTSDLGFLFESTDYYHLYRWTGSTWTWGPGDPGNGGQKCDFVKAPTPAAAWKKLDGKGDDGTNPVGGGNPIKFALEDGTLSSVTRLDSLVAGGYIAGGASFTGVLNSATVPTISGVTGSGTANIGNDSGVGTTINNPTTGTPTTLASHTHNHTDAGHTHSLTSANSPIALPGDPIANMVMLPYLRR
jgi:hypothetical protein